MEFSWSPQLAKTLFSVATTLVLAIFADIILRSLIRVPHNFDTRRSRTFATILRNIMTVVIYSIAFYIILATIGINITPFLASAGIVTLVIGLGARTLIEDLINGLFLLSQDSIAIGDAVKIDDAEGKIERVNFRTLTIRSGDGSLHIIPNGQVKKVINLSRYKSRFSIEIPMKADQSIETVLKSANEALTLFEKDKDMSALLLPGSVVDGIEDFKSDGHMILKTTLIVDYENRSTAARHYRYLLKKSFEKHKLSLG
jgi:moderate conductance mechanosensitive channel